MNSLLAVGSGVLLALVFPKVDWHVLAWVAFVPLLLLCTILAAYTGVFAAGVSLAADRGTALLILGPALWVGLEWVRSFFIIGFPWVGLGYSQYGFLNLIQFAEVTGVYGVSGLVMFGNCILFVVVSRRGPGRGRLLLALLVLVVGLGELAPRPVGRNAARTHAPRGYCSGLPLGRAHPNWASGRPERGGRTHHTGRRGRAPRRPLRSPDSLPRITSGGGDRRRHAAGSRLQPVLVRIGSARRGRAKDFSPLLLPSNLRTLFPRSCLGAGSLPLSVVPELAVP